MPDPNPSAKAMTAGDEAFWNLVQRLKQLATRDLPQDVRTDGPDAASRLVSLHVRASAADAAEERVRKLKEALRPLGELATTYERSVGNWPLSDADMAQVPMRLLRAARAHTQTMQDGETQ